MSEAAVKRRDLENFDPDTPLEKLRRAREEMQRNLQQPVNARAMRVCTSCSERWDTAEEVVITGGWCITCHGSTAQLQSASALEYLVPYSSFCVYQKQLHHCLLYTSPSPRDGLLSRMPSSA